MKCDDKPSVRKANQILRYKKTFKVPLGDRLKDEHILYKITWDLDVGCWVAFLAFLTLGAWMFKSARILSNNKIAKELRAGTERWMIQSIDVL